MQDFATVSMAFYDNNVDHSGVACQLLSADGNKYVCGRAVPLPSDCRSHTLRWGVLAHQALVLAVFRALERGVRHLRIECTKPALVTQVSHRRAACTRTGSMYTRMVVIGPCMPVFVHKMQLQSFPADDVHRVPMLCKTPHNALLNVQVTISSCACSHTAVPNAAPDSEGSESARSTGAVCGSAALAALRHVDLCA